MTKILFILLLFSNYCQGQYLINGQRFRRLLIDTGGNGVGDGGNVDTGVMTPDNSNRQGKDANGRFWNNITNGFPGTWISDPIDVYGNVVTGFSISCDFKPGGTFAADSSNNYAGWTTGDVGEYPVTATRDNMYVHWSTNGGTSGTHGICSITFVIPSGMTASVKFWGTRVTTGANRILEFKKSTEGTWTTGYNALNNSTFSNGTTISGLTGTTIINVRVQAGLDFGHFSVFDITLSPI